jgi:hypothetical protein
MFSDGLCHVLKFEISWRFTDGYFLRPAYHFERRGFSAIESAVTAGTARRRCTHHLKSLPDLRR